MFFCSQVKSPLWIVQTQWKLQQSLAQASVTLVTCLKLIKGHKQAFFQVFEVKKRN